MKIKGINKKCKLTTISLDSFIEATFYEKCSHNCREIELLNEWANSKKFYCKYIGMIQKYYTNYSMHDESHSISILNAITSIIGKKRIKKLGCMDLWLMLHLAYGHDMGMPFTHEEALKHWKAVLEPENEFGKFITECLNEDDSDNKNAATFIIKISGAVNKEIRDAFPDICIDGELPTEWIVDASKYYSYLMAEFMRQKHAKRAKDLLTNNKELGIYTSSFTVAARFYNYVAQGVAAHGMDFESVLEIKKEEWYNDELCYPAFAAEMLRLGDLMDIDNNRFDSMALKFYGDIPRISMLHKKKHEAITHLLYSPEKIEITAESDELEVCACAEEWFEWLNKEVDNVITHWSQIAPKCLGGCQLGKSVTNIFYRGKRFYGQQSHEFRINKNMLIDLVIGRNLYHSQLDFLKEYLQNSIDALKMQLWIDLLEGELDGFIKGEYEEEMHRTPKEKWLPMYLEKIVFERYKLEVNCQAVKFNAKCPYIVKITVIDRGIGIDKECIEAISNIGSGWRKRKKYFKYLGKMPDWLKPTGGFGIGMQSGFMISDKVTILTKCDNSQGWKIVLHSSGESGKIEEQEYDVKHYGTEISVDIPYDWFMNKENINQYEELTISQVDCFNEEEILDSIYHLVHQYIKMICGNVIFPISVTRENYRSLKVENLMPDDLEKGESYTYENSKYMVFPAKENGQQDQKAYIFWDFDRSIMFKVQPAVAFDKAVLKWYYKGIRVWPDMEYRNDVLARSIGSITVDIMTSDVKKCLTVDRNKFVAEFEHGKLLQQFIKAYLNFFNHNSKIDVLLKIMSETSNGKILGIHSKNIFYTAITMKYYLKNEDAKRDVQQFIKENKSMIDISQDSYISEMQTEDPGGGTDLSKETDDKFDMSEQPDHQYPKIVRCGLSDVYDRVIGNEDIYILQSAIAKDIKNNKVKLPIYRLESGSIATYYVSDEIWALLENFPKKYMEFYDKKNEKYLALKCYGKETNKFFNDEEVIKTFLDNVSDRNIVVMVDENSKYKALFVKNVPSQLKVPKKVSELKNIIISPLSPIVNNIDILDSIVRNKSDKQETYVNYIVSRNDFKLLVHWVCKNQIYENKYSVNQIQDCYKELIRDLFKKASAARLDNERPV